MPHIMEDCISHVDEMEFPVSETALAAYKKELKRCFPIEEKFHSIAMALSSFPEKVEQAHQKNTALDIGLARSLLGKTQTLLTTLSGNLDNPAVPYVLAAVSYLIRQGDGRDDFLEIDGFKDDEQIIDHVIDSFDLQDIPTTSGIEIK